MEENLTGHEVIEEDLTGYYQEDEVLVDIIRKHYIFPPSKLPYNFTRSNPSQSGQFGQPVVVDDIFNNSLPSNGFFIEAGAWDGEGMSNSLLLEFTRGWTGLLVEPAPEAFQALKEKQRKAWISPTCFSTQKHPIWVNFDMAGLLGGIENGEKKPADDSNTIDDSEWMEGFTRRTNKMQCMPLFSMLLALDNPTIHYLSLDIEGAELAVLQTLPWDKVDIRVLTVETNHAGEVFPGDRKDIVTYIRNQGYQHLGIVGIDDIFVKNGLVDVTDNLKSYIQQLRKPRFFKEKDRVNFMKIS